MPRRARRPTASDPNSVRGPSSEHAISARIQATFKKIIVALQEQRDLRCDLASTRTRALVLDSEFVVLHTEFDRSAAARNKLDALSRELARRNKSIDEEAEQSIVAEKKITEDVVQRFNAAMAEINNKLTSKNHSRERRNLYVQTLQNKISVLQERYDMREQHFNQQVKRKQLEQQLLVAKHRELVNTHSATTKQLAQIHQQLQTAKQQHHQLKNDVQHSRTTIRDSDQYLQSTDNLYDTQKTQIDKLQTEAKQLQSANAISRNANNSTNVHIKAMESECKRLEQSIIAARETERKERTKIEALEKLCKQVTIERSELHREILVMQDAWSNLKQEIETLKDQVGESGRVFEVLQNIMNRESLDGAGSSIFRGDRSIEDVISDALSPVRLVSGSQLDEQIPLAATASNPGPSNGILPPG
ncbi:Gamma-taxilin [Gracilariopsis chorda]|uniref:Gamma-taxilin n=1 Tax=Gracilariopsis chorda TaxID=448386 RepID=A0A2V3IGN1_9FLOR|nr:Gamma-taxilin [Gracilariopsis chorda]|eukprot:PXF41212.1 Gamma-taxilin [Gracilariopsis chorda]